VSDSEVTDYIATLPEPRQAQLAFLHKLVREEAPDLPAKLWQYSGALIGYGDYHYKGKSTEGDWFLLGIAARKAYVSLYSMAQDPEGGYYAANFAPRLGVKAGNSCLNIKDPLTVDETLLREFVRESVRLLKIQAPPGAITA
jgi:hypothetical protein